MNIDTASFAIALPEKYLKYGLSNNNKARLAYEYFHDLNLAVKIMAKDPKAYFYFLKRCISRGNIKLFKKLFNSAKWEYEHKETIKSLFVVACKYGKESILKFLYENHNDKLDFSLTELLTNIFYIRRGYKPSKYVYKLIFKHSNILKNITLGQWTTINVLTLNDPNINYLFYNIFDFNKNQKRMPNEEVYALFGYRLDKETKNK